VELQQNSKDEPHGKIPTAAKAVGRAVLLGEVPIAARAASNVIHHTYVPVSLSESKAAEATKPCICLKLMQVSLVSADSITLDKYLTSNGLAYAK
jgi:hypothetical protein